MKVLFSIFKTQLPLILTIAATKLQQNPNGKFAKSLIKSSMAIDAFIDVYQDLKRKLQNQL